MAFEVRTRTEIAKEHYPAEKSKASHARNPQSKKYLMLTLRSKAGTKTTVFFEKDKDISIKFENDHFQTR